MSISSRISSSIKRRKRIGLLRKAGTFSIYILFAVIVLIFTLTFNKLQVKSVSVSGNSTVNKEDILSVVDKKLNNNYLYLIRTDNFFLLRRDEIKSDLLDNFKKLESVNINFRGLNNLEVSVIEREAKYLWCNATSTCYFMDKTGFIFKEAPTLSPNPFFEFFGLITDEPVGKSYLSEKFSNLAAFLDSINEIGFTAKSFNAIDEHKYEINLSSGAKIIFDDKKTFEQDLVSLHAIIDNGYVKPTDKSFEKIKSIDLRYGNKVILN